jgi:hypothetical protein
VLVDEESTHGHSKGTESLAARAAASSDLGAPPVMQRRRHSKARRWRLAVRDNARRPAGRRRRKETRSSRSGLGGRFSYPVQPLIKVLDGLTFKNRYSNRRDGVMRFDQVDRCHTWKGCAATPVGSELHPQIDHEKTIYCIIHHI